MVKTIERVSTPGLLPQIIKYYDVASERVFIDGLRALETEEQPLQLYLRENITKFLLEFAAGVRKTHITYEFDHNDQLVYPGINLPMEPMLEKAVVLSNNGLREQAELTGWRRMQALFGSGQANQVMQLSPPCISNQAHGNYGFLFWFERTPENRIVNHILRYNEDKSTLQTTRRLANAFGLLPSDDIVNTLLANPQGFEANSSKVARRLETLGFRPDNTGYLLEQALFKDPVFLMALGRYERNMLGNFNRHLAEKVLVEMYQLATSKAAFLGLLDRRMSASLSLIFSGGSCPIIGVGTSTYDYASYLLGEPFKCPKCHYKSYSPVGNECPNCHLTKDEWAKEHEICD